MQRVIGLISGTSADGIDAALVELQGGQLDLEVNLLRATTVSYPEPLQRRIVAMGQGQPLSAEAIAELDDAIATVFAQAAQTLIVDSESTAPGKNGDKPHAADGTRVTLIGSHGQTIFHRPPTQTATGPRLGYSWQLGRGSLIAKLTGISTISNFRAADIALGGQGAPLVSPIDVYLLSDPSEHRCVQNLGGIGNVTYLPARSQPDWLAHCFGWDTGPSNSLLDLAISQLTAGAQPYDANGQWAAQGTPQLDLVNQWLHHEYFQQPPPKSTGRELFGEAYLNTCWQDAQHYNLTAADWLATLTELTVASIAQSYRQFLPTQPDRILLCGGGCRNTYLVQRLTEALAPIPVQTTAAWGLDPDYKEAIAFAILAYWHQQGVPGNLPCVTGASAATVLGELHAVT
ncbi:MAG: anhydro-N-acetylmuramic acid kinase [Cyanobacteria bacterium P01_H01_bin.121]